jgi:rod shape-determining protein MreC
VRKQRLDQARPFLVLGIILILWLLAPLMLKSVLRLSFFEMQAPVDAAASYVRDLQTSWSLRTRSKMELIEAGRDLARLNASYELRLQETEGLRAEILRLESLLRLPSRASYRFETARVVRRDFSGWWSRIIIRKGKDYGILPGSPVVFTGGVVGRISEVHAYTSVVDLVSSPSFRLAAALEGDTRPVSYQGGINAPLAPPRGFVEFVAPDAFATREAPRRLVTSGLGGLFPPNLTIGHVTHLEPSSDGLFKLGEVRLDERLATITEVSVLVPLMSD